MEVNHISLDEICTIIQTLCIVVGTWIAIVKFSENDNKGFNKTTDNIKEIVKELR